MKRTVVVALLFGAGALALILAIVIGVAASVGAGNTAKTPMPSAPVEVSPAPDSAAPTATPVAPTPSQSLAPAPTPQPANPQTVVARRGINPLYQLIELSCDEPDSIDVDSWRIDGDNVIYRVSDYETDWSSTATTSFAALEADGSPVFITDAADWQSNGCFP